MAALGPLNRRKGRMGRMALIIVAIAFLIVFVMTALWALNKGEKQSQSNEPAKSKQHTRVGTRLV